VRIHRDDIGRALRREQDQKAARERGVTITVIVDLIH